MAASVNNIAAAFSTSQKTLISSPAISSSPHSPSSATFPSISTTSGALSISASWNPHSTLPRSRRSSLLSFYGPPGRPNSSLLRAPLPLQRSRGAIAVGDAIPCSTLSYFSGGVVRSTTSAELARGRKIVILGVRAAFLPRGWLQRSLGLEELVRRAGDMKRRGAALVACVCVSDVFVMRAWGEKIGAFGSVMMLSDLGAGMARAMGLVADFSGGNEGFGLRSENYCVVVGDGIVKGLFREGDGVGFDDVIRAI